MRLRATSFILQTFLFSSCSQEQQAGVCTVILANPRTGPQAAIGREISRALEITTGELAQRQGRKVVIQEVDTASSPTVAKAEVERAVKKYNSPIVVGSILSAETREFLQPILARGSVVLANGSSDPGIRDLPFRHSKDGFFRNWPADDFEGRVMAEYIRSTNRGKSLIVLHANDPYAAALATAFIKRFTELGGQVIGPDIYPTDFTRFDELLRRNASTPHDGYYVVGFPTDLAGIYNTIRRSEESRDNVTPIYSAVGINTTEFTSLVRPTLDALFFTAPAVDESSGPYFRFRQAYEAKFNGESPDIVATITYDALQIAVNAVEASGCDGTKIKNYLYGAPPFSGASGPTGFDDKGDVFTKGVAINFYEKGRRLQSEVRFAEKK